MGNRKGIRLLHPLAQDQVRLGDITLNVELPWNDCRPYPAVLPKADIFCSDRSNLQEIEHQQAHVSARAQLEAFVKANAVAGSGQTNLQSTSRARCYRLRNSGDKFEEACGDEKVREWLKKYVVDRDQPGYMIVGLYTFFDAQLEQRSSAGHEYEGQARGGGAEAGLTAGDAEFHQAMFTSPGEQIFAIEYRAIQLHWFSRKDLDRARLQRNNCWQIFWGARSEGPREEEEEEDIIEVNLFDEIAQDADLDRTFEVDDI